MYIEKTLAKFNKDKSYAYFPGNTIIHFIDNQEQVKLLSTIRDEMEQCPLFEKFILLPKTSYHMTVCDILTYFDLLTHERFADFKHKQLRKIADIDRQVLEDLRTSRFDLNVTMIPVEIKAKRVALKPKSKEDEESLRAFREAVSQRIGFKLDPKYTFHISLSYQLQELSEEEKTQMDYVLQKLNEKYLSSFGEIKVRFADFTVFNDMSAYGLYEGGREDLGEAKISYTEI